jgi:hypothetical protein
LDCGVPSVFIGGELVVLDVTGSVVIDDLKRPSLVLFESIDFDGEWEAVDDYMLAFAGGDQVWLVINHQRLPESLHFGLCSLLWEGQSVED